MSKNGKKRNNGNPRIKYEKTTLQKCSDSIDVMNMIYHERIMPLILVLLDKGIITDEDLREKQRQLNNGLLETCNSDTDSEETFESSFQPEE